MRKYCLTVGFLCILFFLTGCTGKTRETVSREGFYFDTVVQLSVPEDQEEFLDGAFDVCGRLRKPSAEPGKEASCTGSTIVRTMR